jgi:plastocyanin
MLFAVSHVGAAAPVSVRVLDRNGHPVSGLVVTLQAPGIDKTAVTPEPTIDQIDQRFAPFILAVRSGTAVKFPNSDSVAHQVYSFSAPKRFELGLYRGRPHPPVTFDKPGIVVLGCNIHDKMIGYVYVTDAAYFGKTDVQGTWRSESVSPAQYQLDIWSPLLARDEPSLRQSLVVTDTGTSANENANANANANANSVVIQLKRPVQPEPAAQTDRKLRDY